MLLVHQAGSVKVGEVVRYTLTYTPSHDRILPSPTHLHLKIKNTSAIPLRAAYLHGPYTLHVSAYPATFNPNKKVEDPKKEGVPDFEPLLKAGGQWTTKLLVPDAMRETGASFAASSSAAGARGSKRWSRRASGEQEKQRESQSESRAESEAPAPPPSVTWIIEVASQILFSNSAAVHFEVLVGRDERSLDLGFAAVAGHGHGAPGQVTDHTQDREKSKEGGHGSHGAGNAPGASKGVYSRAVKLLVEDTQTLWDKPELPTRDNPSVSKEEKRQARKSRDGKEKERETGTEKPEKTKKKKKIHLVVLTHGLHSNIGADMLYLKESIDATVKQARLDARKRKEQYREQQRKKNKPQTEGGPDAVPSDADNPDAEDATTAPLTGGQEDLQDGDDGSDDEEQTIVRGFGGNAVRTERGIQYLGKRLAKYILHFTYPDQPFLPIKKSVTRQFADQFKSSAQKNTQSNREGSPSHHGSSILRDESGDLQRRADDLAYTFTSISFIGHSLGGLIQTYAVAYIQKHAPHFFEQIKPVNFICMASPLLGLSNENPMYVKFALDFGLVGRTGQDLGLTWRAPTLAKSGWTAMIGGFGSNAAKEQHQEDPGAKPLLRILPTGPAHQVLRMFRNRTVYANVVNDGIVPLRTSCLLFLDWRGLGKVDKARRENGLLGTMAEWGWSELTGANTVAKSDTINRYLPESEDEDEEESGTNTPTRQGRGETVPQLAEDTTVDDNRRSSVSTNDPDHPKLFLRHSNDAHRSSSMSSADDKSAAKPAEPGIFDNLMSFFRPAPRVQSAKVTRAVRRGQTIHHEDSPSTSDTERTNSTSRGATDNPTMRPHFPARVPSLRSAKRRPTSPRLASRGDSTFTGVEAPPRTSIFESASDILHPPIPSTQWLIDPSTRNRTIFHDRVYHPEDIPPPPARRPTFLARSFSSDSTSLRSRDFSTHSTDVPLTHTDSRPDTSSTTSTATTPGSMKVEEKIARAYHKDLSWRKVLVRLEPDAHNNMIVRRMFANAYGWPVVKHLCDTHFADTFTARERDENEPAIDRAKDERISAEDGEIVKGQKSRDPPERPQSEMREARDELKPLKEASSGAEALRASHGGGPSAASRSLDAAAARGNPETENVGWDDRYFEGSDDEEDDEDGGVDSYARRMQRFLRLNPGAAVKAHGAGWLGGRAAGGEEDSADEGDGAGRARKSQRVSMPRAESKNQQQTPLVTRALTEEPAPLTDELPALPNTHTSPAPATDDAAHTKPESGEDAKTDATSLPVTGGTSQTTIPAPAIPTEPVLAAHTEDLHPPEPNRQELVELGLRKSVEERISPPRTRDGKGEEEGTGQ